MRKWDFNVFVVVGALLGILASMLPWYSLTISGGPGTADIEETTSPADVFLGERSVAFTWTPLCMTSMMLMVAFVASAFLSLHSSICGLVQVVSPPLFMISIGLDFTYTDRGLLFEMEYGVWIAALSSATVLLGLILPMGGRTWRRLDGLVGRLFTFHRSDFMNAKVNLLAFIGACMVLMSLALPNAVLMRNDYSMSVEYPSSYLSGDQDVDWATITTVTGVDSSVLLAVSVLLMGGAILSILTPLGGLATLSGLVLFWSTVLVPPSEYVEYRWLDGLAVHVGIGSVVAAIGAVILIASIVHPLGPIRHQGQRETIDRILVWSTRLRGPTRVGKGQVTAGGRPSLTQQDDGL